MSVRRETKRMAKFKYRMQNILQIKEKLESQAKNEYAQANMQLAMEQDKLKEMLQHEAWLIEEGRALLKKESLSIRDIEDNKLSKELHREAMKKQALVIHNAEQNVEKKRVEMTKLMQDRKTHETLRQKEFEAFLMEEKARESKEIDELTSYTYGIK